MHRWITPDFPAVLESPSAFYSGGSRALLVRQFAQCPARTKGRFEQKSALLYFTITHIGWSKVEKRSTQPLQLRPSVAGY
jgi:hypothetical protein